MGLFDWAKGGDQKETLLALQEQAQANARAYTEMRDRQALQEAALAYLELSLLYSNPHQRSAAFMSGRTFLERAVVECEAEALKAEVLLRAVEIYKESNKAMFLRPLYTDLAAVFERLLYRLKKDPPTLDQLNEKRSYLAPVIEAFHFISKDVTGDDSSWFDRLFLALQKTIREQQSKEGSSSQGRSAAA